ncbi:MAG: caspase family protein, partial [Rhodocyclaceae bacterium]|nr:caspase family protein [Rhodocyclaceae bacterium]
MRPTHEPPQFRPSTPHSPRSGLFCRLLLAWTMLATDGAAPENRALLIAISKYQPSEQARRTPGGTGIDLDGPAHDVAALRDVLIRRWGFRSASIVTLVDAA